MLVNFNNNVFSAIDNEWLSYFNIVNPTKKLSKGMLIMDDMMKITDITLVDMNANISITFEYLVPGKYYIYFDSYAGSSKDKIGYFDIIKGETMTYQGWYGNHLKVGYGYEEVS